MADDLPYKAEYAKSGRASCKSCKSPIAKDTLRLAVMVQSPMFDGKVPNWYHLMCFFGKQRPKCVGDISHFDSLRWEDQEKIKAKVEQANSGSAAPTEVGKKKGKKRGSEIGGLKDFTVQYAKSGRATCKGCEQKILKDVVRISKKDFESENAKMYGGQDRWHHVECFEKLRNDLEFWESGADLPGLKSLSKDDQQMVKDKLPKISPPTKIKTEDEADGPSKTEDEADGPSPPKKVKNDEGDDELKKQSKIMYKFRDQLKQQLKKKDLSLLLEYNNQEIPSGEERILDRLADIMTFGALLPCEQCKGGQFVYRSGLGYQCQGDLTEWTKCKNVAEPKRKPFKVPKELKDSFDFLGKYKYVKRQRIIKVNAPSVTNVQASTSKPLIDRPAPPLSNMEFVLLGKLDRSKDELKKVIKSLGGTVVSKVHDKVAAVISTTKEVEKMGKKMEEIKELDVHIVSEDFLEEAKNGSALLLINKKSICSWGSDPASRVKIDEVDSKSNLKSKSGSSRFTKSVPDKIKLKLKGGVAVDPDSGLEDIAHVFQKDGDIYNAVLGITDVQSGKNSYYKLQVLQSDKGGTYWVFRSWGRIGTTIGNTKLNAIPTLQQALQEFRSVYEEKTGNCWENRKHFVKVPGRMYPIEVEYGEDDKIPEIGNANIESKLAKPVQDLVNMLFDINAMKKVMMEFELDLKKMPLGKLSKRQIQQAYNVLTDLQELMKSEGPESRYVDASNRFYTLIPHDFGVDIPPVLKTEEMIKQKIEMLDSLLEIEIAFNMLKKHDEGDDELHPIDVHYAKLNTDIEVLDKDSEEFKLLTEYVKNTHAATHRQYQLEIEKAFKVRRHGEDKRYKPFRKLHNRKLLWHGSRLTNFAGILSQGLRIAPPEAPVSGYMFGKGIYFADMVSKSANYCCTSRNNPVGLMLLCEVALGNMYERPHADYIQKLPKNKHSVKGLGVTEPDPTKSILRPDGVEVPVGSGVRSQRNDVSLLYNEYIVYDIAQVNIQYLLQMQFKYNY